MLNLSCSGARLSTDSELAFPNERFECCDPHSSRGQCWGLCVAPTLQAGHISMAGVPKAGISRFSRRQMPRSSRAPSISFSFTPAGCMLQMDCVLEMLIGSPNLSRNILGRSAPLTEPCADSRLCSLVPSIDARDCAGAADRNGANVISCDGRAGKLADSPSRDWAGSGCAGSVVSGRCVWTRAACGMVLGDSMHDTSDAAGSIVVFDAGSAIAQDVRSAASVCRVNSCSEASILASTSSTRGRDSSAAAATLSVMLARVARTLEPISVIQPGIASLACSEPRMSVSRSACCLDVHKSGMPAGRCSDVCVMCVIWNCAAPTSLGSLIGRQRLLSHGPAGFPSLPSLACFSCSGPIYMSQDPPWSID